uniref:RH1 domain-containing protein n=1 Tax=Strongyloides stercoralis TaxID=6248 RepID=A0AAF5DB23_STRER
MNTNNEIVYGGSGSGTTESDEQRVMSEKVQMLASSIYKELEAMIQTNGEESVKNLMPLVVSVLESLDLAYLDKEEQAVEIEMLREDNEQLLKQYEREKNLRKHNDQRFFEIEEGLMDQVKEGEKKIESLESVIRMLELKTRNAQDHAQRLEEREAEQRLEFDRLHERYNDLLRTHIEHVERTKYLMGPDKFEMMQSLPFNNGKGRNNTMTISMDAAKVRGMGDIISAVNMSQSTHADMNLANHISSERDWQEEFGDNNDFLQSPRDDILPIVEEKAEEVILEEKDDINDETRSNASLPERIDIKEEVDDVLSADLTGMGKEVENLIKENTELLETKNALNIVKNDLIAQVDQLISEQGILREEIQSLEMSRYKLTEKNKELELEVKELKEKLNNNEDEQENVPMGQRKRFTRAEMARVILEKNGYKEKYMELQDSMKFLEAQRNKKLSAAQAAASANNKRSLWDFFSGLFVPDDGSNTAKGYYQQKKDSRHRRSTGDVREGKRRHISRPPHYDPDQMEEKKMAERREQYKAISKHMKKDDGTRVQAYGWSIPSTVDSASTSAAIPVPVCCRPLMYNHPTLKIWCASGVTLRGGRTKDGGYIIGESIFYSDPNSSIDSDSFTPPTSIADKVEELDYELKSQLKESRENEMLTWESSSLVWICSSNEKKSLVTIIDANNPNNVLETFNVCASHILCVSTVPGVRESDYPGDDNTILISEQFIKEGGYLKDLPGDLNDCKNFGAVEWIPLRVSEVDNIPTYCNVDEKASPRRIRDFSLNDTTNSNKGSLNEILEDKKSNSNSKRILENVSTLSSTKEEVEDKIVDNDTSSSSKDDQNCQMKISSSIMFADEADEEVSEKINENVMSQLSSHIRDGLSRYEGIGTISTVQPTMWMGSENDYIFVHSGVSDWKKCLLRIKMADAVLSILHYKGRIFTAMANGTIAVFHRDSDGLWSAEGYHKISLGKGTSSVTTLTIVSGRIWAAYRNCVVVIDPRNLKIEKVFMAHPKRDSQVKGMQWLGDGVWISIRLDSTIRLFHAHTYEHLQDVNIEPFITKMLGTNKLDFLHLRITSLVITNRRMWIGTGTGVIVSVPLNEQSNSKKQEIYSDPSTERVAASSFIPYCDMEQAQVSYHGHKDSIRFLLPIPAGSAKPKMVLDTEVRKLLVVSGGDGYIDFRLGEENEEINGNIEEGPSHIVKPRDMSHIIVWEMTCTSEPPSSEKCGVDT